MSGIRTEISDLQIFSQDDGADIFGHQDAAVDIGFDDAAGAEAFKVLDLDDIRAGITAKKIVV